MNHYLSKKAYVFLNFFLYAGMTAIFNVVTGNLYRLDYEFPAVVLIGMKVVILFIAAFITAGRFLIIEKRPPSADEKNSLTFWAFIVLVLGMILYVPLALGLSKMRPDLNTNDVMFGLIMMLGILTTCSLLFLHLNFGLIARMRHVQN